VLGILTAVLLSTAITYAVERPILEADMGAVWRSFQARLRGQLAALPEAPAEKTSARAGALR
jgi:hypothetical protein